MSALDAALAGLERRFKDRCRRDLQTVRALIAGGDLFGDPAYQLIHGLAGAGGTFGFPEVSVAARAVEIELKERRPPGDERLLALVQALEAAAL